MRPSDDERNWITCPRCSQSVSFSWKDGFISEPHNILVADWVYHIECWEEIEKSFPEIESQGNTEFEDIPF